MKGERGSSPFLKPTLSRRQDERASNDDDQSTECNAGHSPRDAGRLIDEVPERSETVPQVQAWRNGDRSKREHCPKRRTCVEHFAAIANTIKGTHGNVGAVGDEAKPRETPSCVAHHIEVPRDNREDRERNNTTDNRPEPHDNSGMRIG